ncbi:mRNA turnover and ribosome assembly protein [Gurleya vavrai]
MVLVQKKKNSEIKDKTIQQIDTFTSKFKHLIIATSNNLRSQFIHDLRSQLTDSKILFGKKKILAKALESKLKKVKLIEKFDSNTFLIFTNDLKIIDKLNGSVKGFLRSGDTTEEEIVLEAGIIKINEVDCSVDMDSRFRNCGVSCYVKNGKVIIDSDFTVCKKGEVLSDKKAKLLRFLGHKLGVLRIKVLEIMSIDN